MYCFQRHMYNNDNVSPRVCLSIQMLERIVHIYALGKRTRTHMQVNEWMVLHTMNLSSKQFLAQANSISFSRTFNNFNNTFIFMFVSILYEEKKLKQFSVFMWKIVNKLMCVSFTKAVNDFQPYYWDVWVYKPYEHVQCYCGRFRIAVYFKRTKWTV